MSVDPLARINEWKKKDWLWKYIYNPITLPFTVPAGGSVVIPSPNFLYNYPEGIFEFIVVVADDPNIGFRFQADPQIDTRETSVIKNYSLTSLKNQFGSIHVSIPPYTPQGIYEMSVGYSTFFEKWAKLSIINIDPIYPHTCLQVIYEMAVLIKKEPASLEELNA